MLFLESLSSPERLFYLGPPKTIYALSSPSEL